MWLWCSAWLEYACDKSVLLFVVLCKRSEICALRTHTKFYPNNGKKRDFFSVNTHKKYEKRRKKKRYNILMKEPRIWQKHKSGHTRTHVIQPSQVKPIRIHSQSSSSIFLINSVFSSSLLLIITFTVLNIFPRISFSFALVMWNVKSQQLSTVSWKWTNMKKKTQTHSSERADT